MGSYVIVPREEGDTGFSLIIRLNGWEIKMIACSIAPCV